MSTTTTVTVPPVELDKLSPQSQWAAWAIRKELAAIQKLVISPEASQANLAPVANQLFGAGKENKVFKVGIVGAGAAGLFTAMIFDFLKKEYKLQVEYEILECNHEGRVGGRLFSYYFSDLTGEHPTGPHDYYDVGAMRFPEIKVMQRTFDLFKYLGMEKYPDGKTVPKGNLRPYHLKGTNVPSLYNDIQFINPDGNTVATGKTFNITGLSKDIEDANPGDLIGHDIKEFTDAHKKMSEAEFWKFLMEKGDPFSVRQWLAMKGRNYNTIEFLETMEYGNRWYDQALSEMVLETINFNPKALWWCIEGGAQQIARRMRDKLERKDSIQYGKRVVALDRINNDKKDTTGIKVTVEGEIQPREYDAVINSVPLGAMQHMRLEGLNLHWAAKQAIRSLGYGASCKVGVRFKTMWWMDEKNAKLNIRGGVAKTDLPIRCCVYPSYNLDDPVDKPGVLLVSYTWSQEADRIGALMSKNSPEGESELKSVIIHDLARLHAKTKDDADYKRLHKIISDNWLTHYAHDWSSSSTSVSAFAYFGPGQFQNMYPGVTCSDGKHIIVGEGASAHHAWVVGSLESAARGVYQFLNRHAWQDRAALKACEAYTSNKIPSPFGPVPPEFARTDDMSSLPAGSEEPTAAASAVGELARTQVLMEVARIEEGKDKLDATPLSKELRQPIESAAPPVG